MRNLSLIILAFLVGCAGSNPKVDSISRDGSVSATPDAASTPTGKSPSQIATAANEAIVSIEGFRGDHPTQAGTGFFIRNNGVLITNLHVVAGAEKLTVELANGEVYDSVFVLAWDERRDLIILQIPATDVPSLTVTDDRQMTVGDPVYVFGNPLGLRQTFSDGLLSGKRTEDGVAYLQISAPISEGSSGGPVMNRAGEVVGIATSIYTEGQNLNMAVPARHALGLLQVSSTPRRFELIAEEFYSPTIAEVEARRAQTSELLEALPENARTTVDEMSPYEQQAALRVLALSFAATEEGWEFSDVSKGGALQSDESDGVSVFLGAGDYLAVGACDDDCTDLDIHVLDSDGNIIAQDIEIDAEAAVQFLINVPGYYVIGATMASCTTSDCIYMIELFE